MHICLVEPVDAKPAGELHYIHRAAHGSETIGIKSAASERLLDDLEREFPQVFAEPVYPIHKGRDPFRIKLVDEAVQPKRRKLYPLLELELQELRT